MALSASALFVPILGFLTSTVTTCDDSYDLSSCWNTAHMAKSVLTVVVIIFFIAVASRPHARLDLLHITVRTLLTVLTVVFETYGSDKVNSGKRQMSTWVMAIACVITSAALALGYIWVLHPYYNFRYAIFRACLMTNFFWASFCFLFTTIRPNSDLGIVYLVLAPISVVFAGFLVEARKRGIVNLPISAITDPFTLELFVRLRLMDSGLLYRDSSTAFAGTADLEQGNGRGRPGFGMSMNGSRQSAGMSNERASALMDELVEAFVIATKNIPKSCMLQIFTGAFHLTYLNNRAQCMATYTRAETLHPKLDESYLIFRRQRLLNERFSGGDVIDFIAFEQNMQQAKKFDKKAVYAIIHFWSELLKKQPSFRKLQKYGAAISSAISSAQNHYMALIKLSPDAPHVYRLYGHFLINVLNDAKQGQDLLDHADELEEEHHHQRDSNSSEDNVIITISGERQNLGHIINVNVMTTKVFGYKRQELMQQNINKLLPSPFSEFHDIFLQRYLETGLAKVVDRSRQVLGLSKQGYIFPITLCVKHVVDPKGTQSFIGTERRPKITDWLPGATQEASAQLISKTGLKLQHSFNGLNYDVFIHGDQVQVMGASCVICRVKFKVERTELQEEYQPTANVDSSIPGGCPYSGGRRGSTNRVRHASNQEGKIQEETESSGSIDMPMSFSAHVSKDNISVAHGASAVFNPPVPLKISKTHEASRSIVKSPSALSQRQGILSQNNEGDDKGVRNSKYKNEEDEKGSQSSRNSKGTAKSYIKRILTLKNEKSNRRLQFLSNAFAVILIILSIISVIICIEYRKFYDNANFALGNILYQNDISVKMIQVADSARSLDIERTSGWFWESAASYTRGNTTRDELDKASLSIRTKASVVASCSQAPTRLRPLALTLASARYLVQASLQDPDFKSEAAFVVLNAPYEVLRVVNSCAIADKAEAARLGKRLPTLMLLYSSIGPAISLILLLCIIQPLYMRIEDNKERFLRMFYSIPKEVAKGIYQSHLQRVLSADEDEEDQDLNMVNKFTLEKVFASAEDGDKGGDIIHSTRKMSCLSDGETNTKAPFFRWFWKAIEDQHRVLLKSLLIFLITATHFFVVGGLSHVYLSNVDDVATSVYWSSQRQILLRESTFFVREVFIDLVRNASLARGISPDNTSLALYTDSVSLRSNLVLGKLAELDDAILFGNAALDLQGVLTYGYTSPQVILEMQNACVEGSPADCTSFETGVMTRGLHAASQFYQKRVISVLGRISSADLSGNQTAWMAVLSDVDATINTLRKWDFNYLTPAYEAATTFYLTNIRHVISWFSSFHLASLILFVA
ncbi:hypothetical protein BC829DRAFT_391289 [Chytridium lagenaria]|nr:hypothetical protein BC829DRAFT_391289 [Chytridium lagenaria]